MSRGCLSETEVQLIESQLPQIEDLQQKVLAVSPDFVSTAFGVDSSAPSAVVCLEGTLHALAEARYALHEARAHQVCYLQKANLPDQHAAVFFSKFYTDDVALRLYSAGEHLAQAILDMLEITDSDLAPYKAGRTSLQTIVGHYLISEKPAHEITGAIHTLATSPEWRNAMNHRAKWVHDQPPLIEGLGIRYKRGARWQDFQNRRADILRIGMGDRPNISIGDLMRTMEFAFTQFVAACRHVVDSYMELLIQHGFVFKPDGKVRINIP